MNYRVTKQIVVDGIQNEQKVPVALEPGFTLKFLKNKEGISFFEIVNAYSILLNTIILMNEEQRNEALEEITEATAESKEEPKENKVKYALDPSKKYSGDEGIDYIVLCLQNNELSNLITRDDSKTLFVDLGSIDMFPDAESTEWIMKLNARIPIKTAVSISTRVKVGKKHLGIVMHEGFV